MKNNRLTVVIPVYNRASIVNRTLKSLDGQTYRPLKVILVDNNSKDNTMEVLSEWKRSNESDDYAIEILTEKQPGACNARNTGLMMCDTEWTMFFDSDDTMPADHIEKAMNVANRHPEVDIIGWDRKIHFIDGKVQIKKFSDKNPEYENLTQSILATQSYMAKTELFRQAGGWNPEMEMGDDIELGSRLLALNPKVTNIPGHHVDVFDSQVSITNSTVNRIKSLEKSYGKIKETLPDDKKHWVDLQMIVKAASWGKDDPESKKTIDKIISATPWPRQILWKIFYFYQLHGGRGVAKIYSLLHLNRMKV